MTGSLEVTTGVVTTGAQAVVAMPVLAMPVVAAWTPLLPGRFAPPALTLLTVLLAVAATLLAVPRPCGARATGRMTVAPEADEGPGRRRLVPVLVVLATAVAVALGALLGGVRGAVLVLAGAVVIGTVARVVVLHAAERRARRAQADVAAACAVLASYVRVGQVAADALVQVARDCRVLAEAAAVQQIGGDVPTVLRSGSVRPGHGGLADLARAWQVSTTTGAPMAPALEEVAAGLASDESLRSVVSAELSAPRSTGKVMAVLPLVGIALGYLLGGSPLAWLVAGPLGWACLLAGLLLAAAGVLWIERLAQAGAAGG